MAGPGRSNDPTPRVDAKGPLDPDMCGARKKGTDLLCRARSMANGRCRMHGGATPRGAAHPRYMKGKSRTSFLASLLPMRLRDKFEEAIRDPELMSMRHYVALYDARVGESLERYGELDPGTYRTEMRTKWDAFKRANAKQATTDEEKQAKSAAVVAALGDIESLIERGGEEAAAWAEVDAAVKNRVSVTNAENRRLIDMQQMLSVEQAMDILYTLSEILINHIKDRALLSVISNEIEAKLGLNAVGVSEGDAGDLEDAETGEEDA